MHTALTLIPITMFLLLTGGTALLLKRNFGTVLPLTLCLSILLMYGSQHLFSTYRFGYCLLILCALLALLLMVLLCLRKSDALSRFVFTPGMIAYLVVCLVAVFILFGRRYSDYDELSHWGMMLKESLRLDRFACVNESNQLWHKDYPPFSTLFMLIWCKFTGFSEGVSTIAMQVLTMSLILPPLVEHTYKDSKKPCWYSVCIRSICLEVILFMVTLFFDTKTPHLLNSILPDMLLAYLFASAALFMLASHIFNDWIAFLTVVMLGCGLVLTKQSGIAQLMVLGDMS